MKKILITGASGNVGLAVVKHLANLDGDFQVFAGVRDPAADAELMLAHNALTLHFDFTDTASVAAALAGCDALFLLRPPQIADVKRYFHPVIELAKTSGVGHIVFLSVQGAESSRFIPHHKIEKRIVQSCIPYTFLRPAYFMQNFTTVLLPGIVEHDAIYLPAGNAPFALADVEDIGHVAAQVLTAPAKHTHKAYDLTSAELLSFPAMAAILSQHIGRPITYTSPNPLAFYFQKRRENTPPMYILVMIMLHYLPRFQRAPALSDWIEKITHQPPTRFADFVAQHRQVFQPPGGIAHRNG